MNLKIGLIVMAILGQLAVSATAGGLDFLQSRKYGYTLGISRAASYQLMPGDYLQVDVISGPPSARTSETVLKKVQVIRILDSKTPAVHVSLAMTERELRKMQRALAKVQPRVALRIVQKQPRSEMAEAEDDVLPDLDFEKSTDLAQQPAQPE